MDRVLTEHERSVVLQALEKVADQNLPSWRGNLGEDAWVAYNLVQDLRVPQSIRISTE